MSDKSAQDQPALDGLREKIDGIDAELVKLLSERAQVVVQVGRLKRNWEGEAFYRPAREAEILRKIIDQNPGPLPKGEMVRLFREIMSACMTLERPLRIVYLGPEGTFTQVAALKHFGHSVQTTAMGSIEQVFREVESGDYQYGVVPVENSIEGVVNHTLDLLVDSPLVICGEVELRIHHYLHSKEDHPDKIKRIYSHQQSFAQCRAWLDTHLPDAERVSVSSNAEAARLASIEPNVGAIAGQAAAELYNLSSLAGNIEDKMDNTTRFLVIGQQNDVAPSGDDKTSLLFSSANKPGALQEMLACFSSSGVNMTRIESRPSRKGMWEYIFFVDVEGHVQEAKVALALRKLEESTIMVKLLGSYPRAVL